MTLGEIIQEGHSTFSYKVTAAISDLRDKLKPLKKTVKCYQDAEPSKNRYVIEDLEEYQPEQPKYNFFQNQGYLL